MSTAAVVAKFPLAEDSKDIQHKEIQHDVGHLSIKDVACGHKQHQTECWWKTVWPTDEKLLRFHTVNTLKGPTLHSDGQQINPPIGQLTIKIP